MSRAPDLPNVHPGTVLKEDFLDELGISQYQLAQKIGISRMTISKVVRGKQRITAELALRLARFFGTTPQFWLNLQQAWDLEEAKAALKDELGKIQPLRPSEKENSAISGA